MSLGLRNSAGGGRKKKARTGFTAAGPGTSGAYRKVDISTRLHPAPSSPSAPRRSVRLRTHIKKSPERECRFPGQGLRVSIREAIYTRFDHPLLSEHVLCVCAHKEILIFMHAS